MTSNWTLAGLLALAAVLGGLSTYPWLAVIFGGLGTAAALAAAKEG